MLSVPVQVSGEISGSDASPRVDIEYDFKDSSQVVDFFPETDILRRYHGSFPKREPKDYRGIEFEDGQLVMHGAVALEHLLPLAAPFKFKLVFTLRDDEALENENFALMLVTCADAEQHLLGANHSGALSLFEPKNARTAQGLGSIFADQEVEIELEHDGKQLICRSNGAEVNREDVPELSGGRWALWCNSPYEFGIESLVVSAAIDLKTVEPLRDRWVEMQLRDLDLE